MADYVKYVLLPTSSSTTPMPDFSTVLDSVDDPDPEPEAGDELFGAEGDEAPAPENDDDLLTMEIPKLLYCNRNPGTPCPTCRPYIGTIWQLGCQPRVPRHDGCQCYYQQVYLYETKNRNRFRHKPRNQAAAEDRLL